MDKIKDINNWTEVTKGMFRYVIAAGACYEIIVAYLNHDDILTEAYAKLYITGDWHSKERGSYFNRECIFEGTLIKCLDKAAKDFSENHTLHCTNRRFVCRK